LLLARALSLSLSLSHPLSLSLSLSIHIYSIFSAELLSRLACPRIQKGTLLLSSTPKSDFSFGGSVVLIYRHDPYGTEGVIINQDIGPLEEYLYPNGSEVLDLHALLVQKYEY